LERLLGEADGYPEDDFQRAVLQTAPVLIAALRLADARVLAVNARILFDHGPADEHAMERWARAHKAADAELAAFAAYCALLDGLPKTEGT
jgi:hypothetical protein